MKIRTSIPKSGKLVTAYRNGGETFRTYCLRYGDVKKMNDWEDPINGKPIRKYVVHIDGLRASFTMECGEVIRFSYGLIEE